MFEKPFDIENTPHNTADHTEFSAGKMSSQYYVESITGGANSNEKSDRKGLVVTFVLFFNLLVQKRVTGWKIVCQQPE